MVKTQLRLESVEQQASDAKIRVSELLEKYSEAQRVIAELKASIQKINDEHLGCEAKHLTLKQNCNDAERNFSDLLRKYEDAQRALTDLEARFREINHEHADCEEKRTTLELRYDGTKALLDDCQARLQMLEEQNKQLEAQVEALQNRTRAEVDVALNLESYKKRAQLALQKVPKQLFFRVSTDYCAMFRLIPMSHISPKKKMRYWRSVTKCSSCLAFLKKTMLLWSARSLICLLYTTRRGE